MANKKNKRMANHKEKAFDQDQPRGYGDKKLKGPNRPAE